MSQLFEVAALAGQLSLHERMSEYLSLRTCSFITPTAPIYVFGDTNVSVERFVRTPPRPCGLLRPCLQSALECVCSRGYRVVSVILLRDPTTLMFSREEHHALIDRHLNAALRHAIARKVIP